MYVLPREILASRPFLAKIEAGLATLTDRRVLLVWATKDFAFRSAELRHWEGLFPEHRTVMLDGAGHYIQEDAPRGNCRGHPGPGLPPPDQIDTVRRGQASGRPTSWPTSIRCPSGSRR